jgi:hypothetical protein
MKLAQGTVHEERPDVEPLLSIDFYESPNIDDDARTEWHLSMAGTICRTVAEGPGAFQGFTGILQELGEGPAWHFLRDVAVHNGFDVYDSDTLFAVYRGLVDDPTEPITLAESVSRLAASAELTRTRLFLADGFEIRQVMSCYPELPSLDVLAKELSIWDKRVGRQSE